MKRGLGKAPHGPHVERPERYRRVASTLREMTPGDWKRLLDEAIPQLARVVAADGRHGGSGDEKTDPAKPPIPQRFRVVGATGFEPATP